MQFNEGDLVRFLPEYALENQGEYTVIEVHGDLNMVSLLISEDEYVLVSNHMIRKNNLNLFVLH